MDPIKQIIYGYSDDDEERKKKLKGGDSGVADIIYNNGKEYANAQARQNFVAPRTVQVQDSVRNNIESSKAKAENLIKENPGKNFFEQGIEKAKQIGKSILDSFNNESKKGVQSINTDRVDDPNSLEIPNSILGAPENTSKPKGLEGTPDDEWVERAIFADKKLVEIDDTLARLDKADTRQVVYKTGATDSNTVYDKSEQERQASIDRQRANLLKARKALQQYIGREAIERDLFSSIGEALDWRNIPFLGDAISGADTIADIKAGQEYEKGKVVNPNITTATESGLDKFTTFLDTAEKWDSAEDLNPDDVSQMTKLIAKTFNDSIDRGVWWNVGQMMVSTAKFGVELWATGGAYEVGKQAVNKTAGETGKKLVKRELLKQMTKQFGDDISREALEGAAKEAGVSFAEAEIRSLAGKKLTKEVINSAIGKKTVNEFITGVAGTLAGELTRSPAMVAQIGSNTASYMMPNYDLVAGENGTRAIAVVKDGDNFEKALTKSFGSLMINNVTEHLGAVVEDPLDNLQRAFLNKIVDIKGFKTSQQLESYLKKSNWNGLISEVFEEEIGEPLSAWLEEREYQDPITTAEGRQRLLIETLGIGLYEGALKIPDQTIQYLQKKRREYNLTPIEIEQIAQLEAYDGPQYQVESNNDIEEAYPEDFNVLNEAQESVDPLILNVGGDSPEDVQKFIEQVSIISPSKKDMVTKFFESHEGEYITREMLEAEGIIEVAKAIKLKGLKYYTDEDMPGKPSAVEKTEVKKPVEIDITKEVAKHNSIDSLVSSLEEQGKIFYHGTPNGEFEEFNEVKRGTGADSKLGFGDYGKGIYFSLTEADAQSYADNLSKENGTDTPAVIKAFVDNKKPLDLRKLATTQNAINQTAKELGKTPVNLSDEEMTAIFRYAGTTEEEYNYMNDLQGELGDNWADIEIGDILKEKGYDSLISSDGSELVVFDKNLIKTKKQLEKLLKEKDTKKTEQSKEVKKDKKKSPNNKKAEDNLFVETSEGYDYSFDKTKGAISIPSNAKGQLIQEMGTGRIYIIDGYKEGNFKREIAMLTDVFSKESFEEPTGMSGIGRNIFLKLEGVNPDGSLTEETIEKMTREYSNNGSAVFKDGDPYSGGGFTLDGPVYNDKIMDIVIGAGGARKSSMIARPRSSIYNSFISDTDLVKEFDPRFARGRGNEIVQADCSKIAAKVLDQKIKEGSNIIYATIGSDAKPIQQRIRAAQKIGYVIRLHKASLSIEKIQESVEERESIEGRHTYMDRVEKQIVDTEITFNKLKQNPYILKYTEYDTDQPRGQKPQVLQSNSSGSTTNNDSIKRGDRGNEKAESVVQEVRELQEPTEGSELDYFETDRTVVNTNTGKSDLEAALENNLTKIIDQVRWGVNYLTMTEKTTSEGSRYSMFFNGQFVSVTFNKDTAIERFESRKKEESRKDKKTPVIKVANTRIVPNRDGSITGVKTSFDRYYSTEIKPESPTIPIKGELRDVTDQKEIESPAIEEKKPLSNEYGVEDFTINKETDTRDGSDLWVFKPTNRITPDQFSSLRYALKRQGLTWSRFKKGFITTSDPAEKINAILNNNVIIKQDENKQENTRPSSGVQGTIRSERVPAPSTDSSESARGSDQQTSVSPQNDEGSSLNSPRDGFSGEGATSKRIGKVGRQKINEEVIAILEENNYSPDRVDYSPEEIELLKQYTGAGGKESAGATGKGLLSEYYTPKEITTKLWEIIKTLAPDAKTGYEPSLGIGDLLIGKPSNIKMEGGEYQKISGTIAQVLYPDVKVRIGNGTEFDNKGDFQTLFYGQKEIPSYDIVIGNPPFGSRDGFLKGKGEEPKINRQEEYFIKRGLDILNPDGILVYVVNSSFLTKGNTAGKELIAQNGKLVQAFRLPEGIFADTGIGTDIVVFQKTARLNPKIEADQQEIMNRTIDLSNMEYFKQNKVDVLGDLRTRMNKFGKVEPFVEGDINDIKRLQIRPSEKKVNKINKIKEKLKLVDTTIKAKKVSYAEQTRRNIGKQQKSKSLPAIIKPDKDSKGVEVVGSQTLTDSNIIDNVELDILINTNEDGTTPYNDKGLSYLNYAGGKYYHNVNYFAGDVIKKIEQLKADKESIIATHSLQQYEKQMEGLERIVPKRMDIEEVTFDPLDRYIANKEVTIKGENISILRGFTSWLYNSKPPLSFKVQSNDIVNYVLQNRMRSGTKNIKGYIRDDATRLFNAYLRGKLEPSVQAEIMDQYNREKNSWVDLDYSKLPVLIKGMAREFRGKVLKLSPTQIQGVSFLSMKGVGLIAYGVGVGKTFTMLIATMVNNQKGWNKRPAFVVPKATLSKTWIASIKALFPNKTIVNLGGLTVPDIKKLTAERGADPKDWIKDGEITVITHEGLTRLALKPEELQEATADLLDVLLTQAEGKTDRQKEEEMGKLGSFVGKAQKKANSIYFTDLGIDHLSVDEVHNFRKVFQAAKPENLDEEGKPVGTKRFSNVDGGTPSAMAQQLFIISQFVLKRNNNRGIFLASATPFENKATEIYNVLSFIARDRLRSMGIANINDFYALFSNFTSELTKDSRGKWGQKDKMKSFRNLAALQSLLRQYIDYKVDDTLVRPEKKVYTPQLQMSELQEENLAKIQTMLNPQEGQEEEDGAVLKASTYSIANSISPFFIKEYYPSLVTGEELVKHSPKLEYAMKAIDLYKKDPRTSKYGTFIYLGDNGKEYHHIYADHIAKELGFKDSEVAVINGDTKDTDRDLIKTDFNSGKIKVLIGGSPTKEGIDLQDNGFATINVALGWNPTEMAQVEGRLWRQGNKRSFAPIIYPLVENSGDITIYDKFEEKGGRINDLFSYVGEIFDVSEVDPVERKLALMTSPEDKANLSIEMDKMSLQQKVLMYQTDIDSFVSAKDSLNNLNVQIERYSNIIKEKKDGWRELNDEQIAQYKKELSKEKAAKKRLDERLSRAGIKSIEDIEKKIQEQIVEAAAIDIQIKELDAQLPEMLKKYQLEYDEMIANRKSIDQLVGDLSSDLDSLRELSDNEVEEKRQVLIEKSEKKKSNTARTSSEVKEMYKAPEVEAQEDIFNSDLTTNPNGYADAGGYADSVERVKENLTTIKPVALTELVKLYEEITGGLTPQITTKFRTSLGKAMGLTIKLSNTIFADPELAAKVMAHEMGHVFDFLPDKTMARGNILGRLNSLKKYMQKTFGEMENNDIYKNELKELTQIWKPFDITANPDYTNYRYSSAELYADAISVLLNDPELLAATAPNFYKAFYSGLDTKPEVKEALFKVWDIINAGEDSLYESRDQDLDKMFGNAAAMHEALEVKKNQRRDSIIEEIKEAFIDKNIKILDKYEEARKGGRRIQDDFNPKYVYERLQNLEGPLKAFSDKWIQPMADLAKKEDLDYKTFGKILMMERVLADRFDKANPKGFTPEVAQSQLNGIRKQVGEEKFNQYYELIGLFRNMNGAVLDIAEKNEFYTEELLETMKDNTAYATFKVIDYLDEKVTAQIYHTVGTLKGIDNPFAATVTKSIKILMSIERNNAKKAIIKGQKQLFPDDIQESESQYVKDEDGEKMVIKETKKEGKTTIKVIEEGKLVGYDIDSYIAKSISTMSSEEIRGIAKIARFFSMSKFYRAVFTTYNLGFQPFNTAKDFLNTYKNMPKSMGNFITSFARLVRGYKNAIPEAWKKANGEMTDRVAEMYEEAIFGMQKNELLFEKEARYVDGKLVNEDDKNILRTLESAGVDTGVEKKGLRGLSKVLSAMEKINEFVEAIPKIAMYTELEGKMTQKERVHHTINFTGTPNYRNTGTATPVTNNLFLFSNIAKEGYRSAAEMMTDPSTRGGWWFKTLLIAVVPTLVQIALSQGLGGEEKKKMLENVSEYDKTNYTIFLLGTDENGKTIYLRGPRDEVSRLIGGLTWKIGQLVTGEEMGLSDAFSLVDYTAGQTPSLSPIFDSGNALLQYFSGKNPYDDFRGRYVIPQTEFNAGPEKSFPILLEYLAKQNGLGIIIPSYTPGAGATELEKTINLPVLSNILGRWLKVSDYGVIEKSYKEQDKINQESALKTLEKRDSISKYAEQFLMSDKSKATKDQILRDLKTEVLGDRPFGGYKGTEKTKETNLMKDFEAAILTESGSSPIYRLSRAYTNTVKRSILDSAKGSMEQWEFRQLLEEAKDKGFISSVLLKEYK